MSKEEAMAAYVAEMKKVAQKVIDTVPMDKSTQEMFRYFEPLYEVIHDMPRPPEAFFRSTAESQGQQDGTSQDGTESSPAPERPRDSLPGQQHVPGPGLAPGPEVTQVTSDSEGDTFSDTLEQMEPEKAGQVRGLPPKSPQAGAEPPEPLSAGQGEGRRAEGSSSSSSTGLPALGSDTDARLPGELEAQVAGAVRALQEELRRVRERLSRLETLGAAQVRPGTALGQSWDRAGTELGSAPGPATRCGDTPALGGDKSWRGEAGAALILPTVEAGLSLAATAPLISLL
uniref:ACB domain-containing protein n=1 Tax=Junco hyemalis TaxID=40217 RepID=A0A8C5IRP3_JUNHY